MGVVSTDIISKCVLLNARILNNKLHAFHKLPSDYLSMLFITESWLSESVTNGMLDCSHSYTIDRKDCPNKQRGAWWSNLHGGNKHTITFYTFAF